MEESTASTTTPSLALPAVNSSKSRNPDEKPNVKLNNIVAASPSPQNPVVAQSARERLRKLETTYRPTTVEQLSIKKPDVEQAATVTAETNALDTPPGILSDTSSQSLVFFYDCASNKSSSSDDEDDDMQRLNMEASVGSFPSLQNGMPSQSLSLPKNNSDKPPPSDDVQARLAMYLQPPGTSYEDDNNEASILSLSSSTDSQAKNNEPTKSIQEEPTDKIKNNGRKYAPHFITLDADDEEAPLLTSSSTTSQENNNSSKSIHFQQPLYPETPEVTNNNNVKTSMTFVPGDENDREVSRTLIDSGVDAHKTAVTPTKSISSLPKQQDDVVPYENDHQASRTLTDSGVGANKPAVSPTKSISSLPKQQQDDAQGLGFGPLLALSSAVSPADNNFNRSIHFQQQDRKESEDTSSFVPHDSDHEASRPLIDSDNVDNARIIELGPHFLPNLQDDARSPIEFESERFQSASDDDDDDDLENPRKKESEAKDSNKSIYLDHADDNVEALKNVRKESRLPPPALSNSIESSPVVNEESSPNADSGDFLGGAIGQSEALLSSSPTDHEIHSVEIDMGDFDDEHRQLIPEQSRLSPEQSPKGSKSADAVPVLPVLLRMPNTGFGIAMGLAGNSIMWRMAGSADFITDRIDTDVPNTISWFAGFIVGMMIFLTYVYKAVFSFDIVVKEYRDPVRVHFMNAPHLVLLMLALGVPNDVNASERALQIVFAVGLLAQTCLTQFIYEKWMFSQNSNISCGRPQFLLSVVGWFLLSALGLIANIDDSWGIALPSFCFGIGAIFYVMVVISVFNRLHENRNQKGSPGLALLIAPPAIAALAIDGFDGDPSEFSIAAEMILGWCLIVLLLILKVGPRIVENPGSFGSYWAYVFPLSALATLCIRYAIVRDTRATDIMAVVFMAVAIIALCVVFVRMVVHMVLCFQEKERWEDPLLGILPKEISLDLRENPQEIRLDPEAHFETSESSPESPSVATDPTSNTKSEKSRSHGINITTSTSSNKFRPSPHHHRLNIPDPPQTQTTLSALL